ncbi:helix-turn-helix transcriptional regulator [Pseudokineococcus basanitobsidens]|uniref:Helix-turn-helix transcriptional regulator n=1 Tax=Pseudokineococcus basanitobsidens TaxID=1926649 RepID=A0ABU8RM94_9ACTN
MPGRDVPAATAPPLLRVLVGQRLRRARTHRGLTLRDVAARADVSIGHLSQVERGLCEVSSEVLAAVCRALGLPLAALLRGVVVDLTVAAGEDGDAVPLTAVPRRAGAAAVLGPPVHAHRRSADAVLRAA